MRTAELPAPAPDRILRLHRASAKRPPSQQARADTKLAYGGAPRPWIQIRRCAVFSVTWSGWEHTEAGGEACKKCSISAKNRLSTPFILKVLETLDI